MRDMAGFQNHRSPDKYFLGISTDGALPWVTELQL